MKIFILSIIVLFSLTNLNAQECDLDTSKSRRQQVTTIEKPLNYVVQMTMKRGKKYYGTAFFIHPREQANYITANYRYKCKQLCEANRLIV